MASFSIKILFCCALIVSAVAGALASFLVPILVAITYVTLLVALAVARLDVPVEARLALSGGAAALARVGVEVETEAAAKKVQGRADAVADVGIVDVVHSGRVGRALDRLSLAAARAGVPEPGVGWAVGEELSVQVSINAETRWFELFANASAFVVLPVVVSWTSRVQAEALRTSPTKSSWAVSRVLRTLAGSDIKIVPISTGRCFRTSTPRTNMFCGLVFQLRKLNFNLFKLRAHLLSCRFESSAEGSQHCQRKSFHLDCYSSKGF